MSIKISYIIATRNRLQYLKITLSKLLSNLIPSEEIVVVDGFSTDGSSEYLSELYKNGKIHQFVSELDINQAHGWNKAMLLANGTIIKKIIDDDIFCIEAIRECARYMIENPEIDICISNDMGVNLNQPDKIEFYSRFDNFFEWKEKKVKAFTFGDVHMLIRRSSLSLIGLYDTSFKMIDWEYSLRISYCRAKIAYFTGYNAMSVGHPDTISNNTSDTNLKFESARACPMYEYKGDSSNISFWSKFKILLGKKFGSKKIAEQSDITVNIKEKYSIYYSYINEYYLKNKNDFLFIM